MLLGRAVDRRLRAVAERGEEVAQQLVVAEVRLVARTSRASTGTTRRCRSSGRSCARCGRRPRTAPRRAGRRSGRRTSHSPTSDWMKPLRIVRPGANEYCAYSVPFGPLTRTPVGVRCSNSFRPAEISGNSSSWRPSLTRGARDRLQPGALREAAHPRRRAAVEVEVVLPREPAAARDGDRHQLVEQQRVARVVALGALRVRVQLPEVRERVELEALAREVLEDELRARERDARAARAAAARPSSTRALRWSWRNSGGSREARSLPRAAIPSVVARTPASSYAPRAGEALDPALDVGQDRPVGVVGRAGRSSPPGRACAARSRSSSSWPPARSSAC